MKELLAADSSASAGSPIKLHLMTKDKRQLLVPLLLCGKKRKASIQEEDWRRESGTDIYLNFKFNAVA